MEHTKKVLAPWETLTLKQKRHRIFKATCTSVLRFWVVCGKDRQIHYQSEVDFSEDTIDKIRDDLYDEYVSCLEKNNIGNKGFRIRKLKKLIY